MNTHKQAKFREIKNQQGEIPAEGARYQWFQDTLTGKEQPGLQQCGPRGAGDDIAYEINSRGFRGREFRGDHAVFGDSYTFGIGVERPFAQTLDYDNVGIPATSNDAIARRVYTYLHEYPNAQTVTVMWTYGYRREWVEPSGSLYEFKRKMKPGSVDFPLSELQNTAYDEYNWQKNQLFVQMICEIKGVQLIETNNHVIDPERYAVGTDGKHPGQDWHDAVAQHIWELANA